MKTTLLLTVAVFLLVPVRLGHAMADSVADSAADPASTESVAVAPSSTESTATPEVVLCLTKSFVRDASRDTFQRVLPVERQIRGVTIRGTAATCGHAVVEFEDTPPQAGADQAPLSFVLRVQGTTRTEAVGRQNKVQVCTLGITEFTAVKRIVFDGNKFIGQPTVVDVRHHTEIGQIACPGGKLRHRLVERLGRPKMEAVRDVGDAMTRRETLEQVRQGVDVEGGYLIALLSDLAPSVQALARLVPDQKPWQVRCGTRGGQVLIACGSENCSLNAASKLLAADRGPVQLWIRDELGPTAVHDILDGCQRINTRIREAYAQRSGGNAPPTDALAVECRGEYLVIAVAPAAFQRGEPRSAPKAEPEPAKHAEPQWASAS